MPKKPNGNGGMQEYIPAGNGDASGEYGNGKGENKHFSSFKKGSSAKSETKGNNTPKRNAKTESGEKIVNGYVIGKGADGQYTVYNNAGHFEEDKNKGYKTEAEAIKRANSLKKGIAVEEDKEHYEIIDKIDNANIPKEKKDYFYKQLELVENNDSDVYTNTAQLLDDLENETNENNNDIFSSIDDFAKDDQLKKGITSQQAYDEMLKGKDIWEALSVDGSLDTALRDKVIDKMTKDLNLSKEDWAKVGITIYDPNELKVQEKPKAYGGKSKPKAKTGLKAFDENDRWDDNDIKEVNDYLNNNPDIKKEVEKRLRDEHKEARNYYPNDEAFNAMVDEDLEGQLASLNDMSSIRYLETLPRDRLVTAIEESIRNKNKSQKPSKAKTTSSNKVTYNGKDYDVDSTAYNGAIINAFGTSITDEKKQGLGGNGYTVFDGGDEIYFKTFDEAYNYAKKNERKKASNLFNVDL